MKIGKGGPSAGNGPLRKSHSFFNHDPQDEKPQYLEDLATAYWFSLSLFTAVESGLFDTLDDAGKDPGEIAGALGFEAGATRRLLEALSTLGLVVRDGERYYNTKVSSDFLVAGKEQYQGRSILWRKELLSHWATLGDCLKEGGRVIAPPQEGSDEHRLLIERYLQAMDSAARHKAEEILPLFEGSPLEGEMLDVGAGSGRIAFAFLRRFPRLKASLIDIPEVIGHTAAHVAKEGLGDRVECRPANILGPWNLEKSRFTLVVLSNIIHAYSEKELPHILKEAASCLDQDGVLLLHDLFFDHFPEKASLFDLNMLVTTYNGRVFPAAAVREELRKLGLNVSDLIPLGSDTSLIAASKGEERLTSLRIDGRTSLMAKIKGLGFRNVLPVSLADVSVPDWVQTRCRFGCDFFGAPGCPPHTPPAGQTRRMLKGYSRALLLEGTPPTRDFQRAVLNAEREAYLAGFHKAFALWAGPCALCPECVKDGPCRNRKQCRPSMEGSGIDVFETVRRAGLDLATLPDKGLFVKYYGLLLVE